MKRLGCIVLAAGSSTRFGSQKLLEDFCGRPLLAATLQSIPKGIFCKMIAVTSSEAVSAVCREQGVAAVQYRGGAQSESIREGLAALQNAELDGCLFLPGDQPLCRHFAEMAAAFDGSVPVRLAHKGVPGSPVLFPAGWFLRLQALNGEKGGSSLLRDVVVRLVEAEKSELRDADTPAALAELIAEKNRREQHGI